MWFVFFFIVALAIVALVIEVLVEIPGVASLDFAGWHFETSHLVAVGVFIAFVAAVILIWAIFVRVLRLPGRVSGGSRAKRREKGFSAVTQGLLAVGAGDVGRARKAAQAAEKLMPNEPLTQLLKAQAAQLAGDRHTAEEAFQKMTLMDETKLLGLRGLHIEARRRDDIEAAYHFAKEANAIAPLPWTGGALLARHAAEGDWDGAREAIESALAAKAIDLPTAQRQRAVVETAMALEKERDNPHDALHLAHLALKRQPGFTPAAVCAARLMTQHGNHKKAVKLIESAWAIAPHPELVEAYRLATPNVSNAQRVTDMERLLGISPKAPESRHAVAEAALAARDFAKARSVLAPLIADGMRPTAHTCVLMAEIEDAEHGPSGPVREWLARASRAPRDPVWLADGVASKHWLPISPATKQLDAFQWKTPPDSAQYLSEDGAPNIPTAFLHPPADRAAMEAQPS